VNRRIRLRELAEGISALVQLVVVLTVLGAVPLGCVFALVYVARLAWTLAGAQ